MKNVLQQHLELKMEDKFANFGRKCIEFINSHPEICCLLLLAIACLLFLFVGIGSYPLIDVDETRYAVMSRDLLTSFNWNDLMLNNVPFLEKPPLYFWLVGASIKFFGKFTPFAVRFPIALLSSIIVFFTYYFGKKIISRKFGMISALTLLSSVFFLVLSHIAIIDMVLTVFMTSAIYCGFLTHFCKEKNKKYLWWYFYLFIGLGFLAKGILAMAIPITVIFIYNYITNTAKEIFKPINLIPGIVLFLLIATPWHLLMYKEYGFEFIKQYFLIHHFGRFMGSEYIGRERPFYYFIPVFLIGFLPWTFIFFAFLVDGFKKLGAKFKVTEGKIKEKIAALFEVTTNEQKLILFASVYFFVVFVLFSAASTKLPTYILPVFPAAALLTGYYWWVSDEKEINEKPIYNLTIIYAAIFIIAAAGASIVYYFLPYDIQSKITTFKETTIISIYLVSMLMAFRLKTRRPLSIFAGYLVFMLFIIILSVTKIFNLIYDTGENEIVNYSITGIRPDNSSQLVTFDFAVKPSVMIEYQSEVNFVTNADFTELEKLLKYKGGPTFVIVKNKNLINNPQYEFELKKKLKLLKVGERYSLYVQDVNNEYKDIQEPPLGL
jgi:4-amino-4-deoxy-L-arabinose transferase-like glycosyltransferase